MFRMMIATTPAMIFGLRARSAEAMLARDEVLGATATLGVVEAGTGRRCLLGAIGLIG